MSLAFESSWHSHGVSEQIGVQAVWLAEAPGATLFFYPKGSRWFLSKEGSNTGWCLGRVDEPPQVLCHQGLGLVEGLECLHCSREP